MDFSSPKLRKILIGVAIFVVVVFIVIRFFRRSNYSYPNTTEQNEYTIISITTTAGSTPASVTVTIPASPAAGIKAGELVFLYGLTPGTLTGTKQVQMSNLPPGVTAPAGAIAVYVLAAPAPTATTFAIEGAVSGTITGGKVQTIGYQPMTSMNNTNTQCQNQYAFDLLDNTITPKVFTPTGTPQTLSSSSKQLNLASAMTFASGDRVTVVGANDSTGSPAFLMVDTASTGTTVTFTAASITALAGSTATILPQSPVANVTKAYNTRQACISVSAMTYTLSHCKYLPPADGSRPLIPTADADPAAASAYTAYTTAMNTIQAQYAPALTRAQNGQFPQGGALAGATLTTAQKVDIVTAARKADLAGATRKYLASVCPGFYAPGDPTLSDPTLTYTKWSIKTGASPAPSTFTDPTFWYATAAVSGGTGGISDADIMAWAKYAGIVTYSGGVSGVTVTTGGSGYVNGSPISFSGGGGAGATGTAVVTNGALTGVTITAPGTGYTSAPAPVFSAGTGAVTSVSLVQTLNASGPFISTGSFATTTYNATDYNKKDSGGEENWRKAYYSGAGTYPRPTYV
jgi:hypothetical protein